MNKELIENLEQEFSVDNYNGVGTDYLLLKGINNNILVSAPHSVSHVRNNNVLPADKYTGTLCKLLNKDLDIPVIYKNKNLNDDVNYDIMTNYEKELIEYIKDKKVKCVIDLHKSKKDRPYDILVADNNSLNLQFKDYIYPIIKGIVLKNGYNIEHNTIFKAEDDGIVSKEISMLTKIPCIELEINSNILNIEDIEQFEKTYNMLKEIVATLDMVL
jgi:hypothetical protein